MQQRQVRIHTQDKSDPTAKRNKVYVNSAWFSKKTPNGSEDRISLYQRVVGVQRAKPFGRSPQRISVLAAARIFLRKTSRERNPQN